MTFYSYVFRNSSLTGLLAEGILVVKIPQQLAYGSNSRTLDEVEWEEIVLLAVMGSYLSCVDCLVDHYCAGHSWF